MEICLNILEMLNYLGFGYYGGSLLIVEVLVVLYGDIMDINFEKFKESDWDYMVLLKGYVGLVLYSIFYLKGFFDKIFFYLFNINGIKLFLYFDCNLIFGIDVMIGLLG